MHSSDQNAPCADPKASSTENLDISNTCSGIAVRTTPLKEWPNIVKLIYDADIDWLWAIVHNNTDAQQGEVLVLNIDPITGEADTHAVIPGLTWRVSAYDEAHKVLYMIDCGSMTLVTVELAKSLAAPDCHEWAWDNTVESSQYGECQQAPEHWFSNFLPVTIAHCSWYRCVQILQHAALCRRRQLGTR
jgi:hypothetical protein